MYVHYIKNYHSSLLTLVTHDNIPMDQEEHLKGSKMASMAREILG